MKRNDIKELTSKSTAELSALLKEHRERSRALRFDLDAGKVKNVAELRAVTKDIARILTVMNAKHE